MVGSWGHCLWGVWEQWRGNREGTPGINQQATGEDSAVVVVWVKQCQTEIKAMLYDYKDWIVIDVLSTIVWS